MAPAADPDPASPLKATPARHASEAAPPNDPRNRLPMRRFSSYGPVDTDLHFHAPRTALVDGVLGALVGGGGPENGGGYITVWAPRQRGESWIVGQAVRRLRDDPRHRELEVVATSVEHLKTVQDAGVVIRRIAADVAGALGVDVGPIRSADEFDAVFRAERRSKPLILVLDEFDALPAEAIEGRDSRSTSTSPTSVSCT